MSMQSIDRFSPLCTRDVTPSPSCIEYRAKLKSIKDLLGKTHLPRGGLGDDKAPEPAANRSQKRFMRPSQKASAAPGKGSVPEGSGLPKWSLTKVRIRL
jgi:hypothetical protein